MQDRFGTEIKYYWPYDGKMHTISIGTDGDDLNLDEILKIVKDIIDEKKEECEKIYNLGISLTGSVAGGRGFTFGWLTRSIRDGIEEKVGKWKIKHEAMQVPESEIQEYIANQLEEMAVWIRESENFKAKDAPILAGGGTDDGTDLFT